MPLFCNIFINNFEMLKVSYLILTIFFHFDTKKSSVNINQKPARVLPATGFSRQAVPG